MQLKLHLFIFMLHYWISSISCDIFHCLFNTREFPTSTERFETVKWSSLEMHFFHSRRDLCKLPLACSIASCGWKNAAAVNIPVWMHHIKVNFFWDVESKLTQKIASAFSFYLSLYSPRVCNFSCEGERTAMKCSRYKIITLIEHEKK